MAGQTRGTLTNIELQLLSDIKKDLAVVKSDVAHLKETVDKQIKDTGDTVEKLRQEIYGNGNPSLGMRADIGILKEWKNNQVWWQRAMLIALFIEGLGIIKLVFFG